LQQQKNNIKSKALVGTATAKTILFTASRVASTGGAEIHDRVFARVSEESRLAHRTIEGAAACGEGRK
jgi:hypothetical protein